VARHKSISKSGPGGTKLVWRISDHAPFGEWVNPRLPAEPAKTKNAPDDEESHIWRRSSFDLMNGLEVNDDPTTVPDDLFDEFFRPVEDRPVPPAKK
jgi:hypothetical protein